MDFFESQEKAKKNTSLLVFLFGVAVLGLVIGTYFFVLFGLSFLEEDVDFGNFNLWDPEIFILSTVGIIGLVGISSLFKTSSLKAGGFVVASSLGGTLIQPNTTDFKRKQLLNIVEEMAIASGTAVPPVYVLEDEMGINAFAAGYHSGDAVIGVTKGALETFDRDELQAVIAHEFSHILNGDMRLNINLIGYLAGIFVLTIIGRVLLRIGFYSGGGNRKNNSAAVLGFLGLGLLIMGSIGLLVGRIIKAAVSRQREFLADASSVQFTRNPSGIYHALKKIKEHSEGSVIESPKAEEASHMFFSLGIKNTFAGMFSTHPPLDKRLKAVQAMSPNMAIEKEAKKSFRDVAAKQEEDAANKAEDNKDRFFRNTVLAGGIISRGGNPASILASAGVLDDQHIVYASQLIASIPEDIKDSARETYGARAVIYCLLLDNNDKAILEKQWKALKQSADPGVLDVAQKIAKEVIRLPSKLRIPLVEMALPALGSLSKDQYASFLNNMNVLIEADDKLDILEWSLHRIITHHLKESIEGRRPPSENQSIQSSVQIISACKVLSILALQTDNQDDSKSAFFSGAEHIGLKNAVMPENVPLSEIYKDLENLEALKPADKKLFLEACEKTIGFDGVINDEEAEVFRAIADSLNCPVPPLIRS
ncbi:MAG: M48 family metallopeptidase [Leptospira sp.]|nr:M48 family metallopeptidase [Leptospira sp.]